MNKAVRQKFLGTLMLALLLQAPALAAPTIVAAGSTALLPLVKSEAEQYARRHPEVQISVSGGGSGAGLTEVAVGAIDIGDSDIPAQGDAQILDHRIAVVGFSMVTHPAVVLRSLTREQLRGIFSGQLTNWREVGGRDLPIVVINRPRVSGTRTVFRHLIMGTTPIADSSLTVDASGTVLTTIASTPGSISYVALSALQHADPHAIKKIAIDGVLASRTEIVNGRYKFWAYEHMYTSNPARPEVERFIQATQHNDDLLSRLGYIPLSAMHACPTDHP